MSTPFPAATILGYPRIGRDRELKRALESFWAGRSSAAELRASAAELRAGTRARLGELGLSGAGVPLDFHYYDQMLSIVATFGAVPERFAHLLDAEGKLSLEGYFTVARGKGELAPLEMTKWFDSNYHYLVPEIGPDTPLRYVDSHVVDYLREAVAAAEQGGAGQGEAGGTSAPRPVLVGPVTFLALSKAADCAPGFDPLTRLEELVEQYAALLADLAGAGAQWVQLDEPALVADFADIDRARLVEAAASAYAKLADAASRPRIIVATPYGTARAALPALAATGVEGFALDLVRGEVPGEDDLAALAGRTVLAGVVSGRNIWRTNLEEALAKLEQVRAGVGPQANVVVSTSTSLQHVPYDVDRETQLDPELRSWLAFADQKVAEVGVLARALSEGRDAVAAEFAADAAARASRAAHPGVNRPEVRAAVAAVVPADRERESFEERDAAQRERLALPLLPTTTIGSFPQTTQIRKARAAHRKGELTDAQYEDAMRAEVASVVALQEELGIDVLVHGEPERNDMVQYFAELLDGFTATQHGWVQSYGSRCTRPSILWGDVSRPAPMTVEWAKYAQSLTDKPVKGMLTGPVTILAWCFVRDDIPLGQTADQVGLALRQEIVDLEEAGIAVIQVDEPALRELLPLEVKDQAEYLEWSVGSFKLSTSGVRPDTQIHTHLCYSEFNVVIGAIDALDADVTSIEAARSRMEILPAVGEHGYERGIGPGVYDIHSPRVPSVEEQVELLRSAAAAVNPRQLWVNPDCGLKTRGYEETKAALDNMVAAALQVRAEIESR
ncbi:5-methyltetrahydropteroyltriglutamate--homocysteine S-methyltransferase [Buchananella felis]|uniref:5-methyltetrahydropteroyltriglutamate-- homocysteine S-methyltransferase n=1 Tax=Buchananella felis TaxID=3231492 RepID=UPI00352838FE